MTALFRLPVEHAPDRHRFTMDDIYRMQDTGFIPPDARFELMDGEIIDMPGEGEAHLSYKAALNRWLVPHLGDDFDMIVDGSLHLAKGDAPEPDFYVYEVGARLEPIDPAVVPLIIEISLSSLGYDLSRKAAKYAEYSLVEYWVIDVNTRVTHVLRNPEASHYRDVARTSFAEPLTSLRAPFPPLRMVDLPRLP